MPDIKAFIGIEIKLSGVQKSLDNVIKFMKKVEKSARGHLSQLNEVTLGDEFQKGVKERFDQYKIRYNTSRGQKIINGFRMKQAQKYGDTKMYKLTHVFYEGKDADWQKTSKSGRVHKIKGSAVLSMLDIGRTGYRIPKTTDYNGSPVLVWTYGTASGYNPVAVRKTSWSRNKTIVYPWKAKGPIKIIRNKSLVYRKGIRFTERGMKFMQKLIDQKKKAIEQKIKDVSNG